MLLILPSIRGAVVFGALFWNSSVGAQPVSAFIIHFAAGQHRLSPAAQQQIENMAKVAIAAAADRVVCIGHSDATGTREGNNILSIRRANAVKEVLVREGVPEAAVLLIGKGASEPASGLPPGSARRSRRVEVVIRPLAVEAVD